MGHLIESKQNLPLGTKAIAEDTERRLYGSLKKTVNDWFDTVHRTTDVYNSLVNLKMAIYVWKTDSKEDIKENVHELYRRGIEAGIKQTGEPVKEKISKVNTAIYKESGIMPAVDKLGDDTFNKIATIMLKHYNKSRGHPLYIEKRDIDSYIGDQRYRTEKMLRTETAKIANWGLLQAWAEDEGRDYYDYHWINPDDDRSKKISVIRKQENPYSFVEIKFLFEHQIQKYDGAWIDDTFFQRCSIARRRAPYKNESNRFRGQEFSYKRTLPA